MTTTALFPHEFRDPRLLEQALDVHSAAGQRLEWLGDRVLAICVAQLLYELDPARDEAELTRAFQRFTCNEQLAEFGQALKVGPGPGDERRSRKAASDVVEALLGAVFIDGGFEAAMVSIRHMYAKKLMEPNAGLWRRDPVSLLKETAEQQRQPEPAYAVTQTEDGFAARCTALGTTKFGHGRTKKEASVAAAQRVVEALGLDGEEDATASDDA